jgi:uncharacterized protein with LGFP repeats
LQSEEEKGPLGFPIGDDHEDGSGFVRQDFENGSLRWDTSLAEMEIIMEPHVDPTFGASF